MNTEERLKKLEDHEKRMKLIITLSFPVGLLSFYVGYSEWGVALFAMIK